MSIPLNAARALRRFGAVPEVGMRRALWREHFERAAPADLLVLVDQVLREVGLRRPDARLAYQALLEYLEASDEADYVRRRALYEVARELENEPVMRLLRSAPAGPSVDPSEINPPPVDREREVTLGERRALARRPDRELLQRLFADPDPGVVANLLDNPKITEADVLRVATRRPTPAELLSMIFRHPRWGRRAEVQRALVYNPYTPVDTAVGLLPLLQWALIVDLQRDPAAHPAIRARATTLVEARVSESTYEIDVEPDPDTSD